MCSKCCEAVKKYWPNLPESEYKTLLLGATCFPFGTAAQTAKQVEDMAQKSNQNVDVALAIAREAIDAVSAIDRVQHEVNRRSLMERTDHGKVV